MDMSSLNRFLEVKDSGRKGTRRAIYTWIPGLETTLLCGIPDPDDENFILEFWSARTERNIQFVSYYGTNIEITRLDPNSETIKQLVTAYGVRDTNHLIRPYVRPVRLATDKPGEEFTSPRMLAKRITADMKRVHVEDCGWVTLSTNGTRYYFYEPSWQFNRQNHVRMSSVDSGADITRTWDKLEEFIAKMLKQWDNPTSINLDDSCMLVEHYY